MDRKSSISPASCVQQRLNGLRTPEELVDAVVVNQSKTSVSSAATSASTVPAIQMIRAEDLEAEAQQQVVDSRPEPNVSSCKVVRHSVQEKFDLNQVFKTLTPPSPLAQQQADTAVQRKMPIDQQSKSAEIDSTKPPPPASELRKKTENKKLSKSRRSKPDNETKTVANKTAKSVSPARFSSAQSKEVRPAKSTCPKSDQPEQEQPIADDPADNRIDARTTSKADDDQQPTVQEPLPVVEPPSSPAAIVEPCAVNCLEGKLRMSSLPSRQALKLVCSQLSPTWFRLRWNWLAESNGSASGHGDFLIEQSRPGSSRWRIVHQSSASHCKLNGFQSASAYCFRVRTMTTTSGREEQLVSNILQLQTPNLAANGVNATTLADQRSSGSKLRNGSLAGSTLGNKMVVSGDQQQSTDAHQSTNDDRSKRSSLLSDKWTLTIGGSVSGLQSFVQRIISDQLYPLLLLIFFTLFSCAIAFSFQRLVYTDSLH